jgi:hypothetical protein
VKQFRVAAIGSVWLMELKSGEQKRLLSFPALEESGGVDGAWINLIGWLEDK